jgi:SAM-dependent methyltransferase
MDSSAYNTQTEVTQIMETVENCPLCQSSKSKLLFWNFDRLYNFAGKFGTLRCEDCSLIRLSPRPSKEHLGNYYPSDYYSYQAPPQSDEENASDSLKIKLRKKGRNMFLASLGYTVEEPAAWQSFLPGAVTNLFYRRYGFGYKFPPYVEKGRALEIGCGSATYLNFLKHYGWQVSGVDLSPHAACAAKEHFDIDVFVGELQDAPFPKEEFDYILMSHVVEHFTNPLESMKKIRELLKPTGIAYIEVPNAESFESGKSGEFWYGWDAPRHLFMFTPLTLSKLLNQSQLKVEKMVTHEWNSFWWDNTFRLEKELGVNFSERPHRAAKYIPKHLFLRFASKINHLLKPESGYNIGCWVSKE